MSPAAAAAAGIVLAVLGVLLVGIGVFVSLSRMGERDEDTNADADQEGDLAAVIPWADLIPAQQPRRLPAWVDDPGSYYQEFLDIADHMPDLDDRFLQIVADPKWEESR